MQKIRSRSRSRSGLVGFVLGAAAVAGLLVTTAVVAQGAPGRSDRGAAPAAPKLPSFVTSPTEDRYVSIAPCRIVDTRAGTGVNGTPFAALQTRTFYVGGTTGFAPQGGVSGGCGIPVGATAISATMTAVTPTGGGYLRTWPNGQAEPTATFLNYAGKSIGSGGTMSINQSSAYALKIRNYSGSTHVVVDVTGYYAKPMAALIQSNGATYDGTNRVLNSGKVATGVYWVELDRSTRYCQATANSYNTISFAKVDTFIEAQSDRIRVTTYNTAGTPIDSWFYIVVNC